MKVKAPTCAILLAIASVAVAQTYEERAWRSLAGNELQATFLRLSGGTVFLKATSGKGMGVPLERLSDEDWLYLEDNGVALPPPTANLGTLRNVDEEGGKPTDLVFETDASGCLLLKYGVHTKRIPPGRFSDFLNTGDVDGTENFVLYEIKKDGTQVPVFVSIKFRLPPPGSREVKLYPSSGQERQLRQFVRRIPAAVRGLKANTRYARLDALRKRREETATQQ